MGQSAPAPKPVLRWGIGTGGHFTPDLAPSPTGTIKILCRVSPRHYPEATNGYVGVYIEGALKCQWEKANTGALTVIHAPLPPRGVTDSTRIFAEHYAIEPLGDFKSIGTRFVGGASVTLFLTATNGIVTSLRDTEGVTVGTIKLGLGSELSLAPSMKSHPIVGGGGVVAVSGGGTNIDYLEPWPFTTVTASVGEVPIWTLPYYVWTMPIKDTAAMASMLTNLAMISYCFMGVGKTPSQAELTEVICEMCNAIPGHCLYVIDASRREEGKEKLNDRWTIIQRQPLLSIASYDCEDGALSGLEISSLLSKAVFLGHELKALQAIERQYTTALCVGTLKISTGWIYHAYLIKFDKRWFAGDYHGPLLEAVLIDSTNYNTSVTSYDSPIHTEEVYAMSATTGATIEIQRKLPGSAMRRYGMDYYGHTQVIMAPSLLDSTGICRYDVTWNGKVGAPTKDVLAYGDMVKLVPTHRGDVKAAMANYYSTMFPVEHPTCTTPTFGLRDFASPKRERLRFDVRTRKVDWHDSMLDKFKAKHPGIKHWTKDVYTVVDGLEGVRVRGFT